MMNDTDNNRPLTTGEWFVTILILALPLIGLVMHFVWAFSDGNLGRRNFCRATLLWAAILIGLAMLVGLAFLLFGAALAAASHA